MLCYGEKIVKHPIKTRSEDKGKVDILHHFLVFILSDCAELYVGRRGFFFIAAHFQKPVRQLIIITC